MNHIERTITLLQRAAAHAPAAFSTSLGLEDMVLTDLIVKHAPSIGVFTLDTGRLHPQTLALLAHTEAHYKKRIAVYYPQTGAVEHYVRLNGINGFYDSVSQRQDCCAVRKVEPLRRALAGKQARGAGLRRKQGQLRSQARAQAPQSVTLLLEDDIDISRGDLIASAAAAPVSATEFSAVVCWIDSEPLDLTRKYVIKLGAKTVTATLSRLDARLDVQTGARQDADTLSLNDIGLAQIKAQQPVAFDTYRDNRATGGFIVIDTVTHHTVAAGMIHG